MGERNSVVRPVVNKGKLYFISISIRDLGSICVIGKMMYNKVYASVAQSAEQLIRNE